MRSRPSASFECSPSRSRTMRRRAGRWKKRATSERRSCGEARSRTARFAISICTRRSDSDGRRTNVLNARRGARAYIDVSMRVSASILVAAFAATALGCGDSPRSRPAGARADTPGSPSSTPQDIDARRGADVGNRYESLPPGVSYLSGAVLPPNRGGAEYELAYLKTPRGDVVWFDSLARTSRPTPTRTVRA